MLFTVSGSVFKSISFLISGLISMDMATRHGAAWRLFKLCLVETIVTSVTVLDVAPPVASGPQDDYLDEVLRRFLPGDGENEQRRIKIKGMLRSDLQSERIFIYKVGGMTPNEVRAWAEKLADELLPTRLGSVKRQRWLTTAKPVSQSALLGVCYNLLERTLYPFVRRAAGKTARPLEPAADAVELAIEDAEVMDGDDAELPPPEAPPPVNNDGSVDWAAWNATQRRTVERFRLTRPTGPLVVSSLVCESLAHLARWIVKMHSHEYDAEQRGAQATTGKSRTIGIELADGEGFRVFKKTINDAFTLEEYWKALPQQLRSVRLRGLATGCLARSLCGVEMLVIADTKRLPHAYDRILLDPAEAEGIYNTPPCRHSRCSAKVAARFDTVEKLQSQKF